MGLECTPPEVKQESGLSVDADGPREHSRRRDLSAPKRTR